MKVVAAWSGGKDSAFAVYKAVQQGFEVMNLVTFMRSEAVSNFHGIPSELLDAQAEAVGIPLVKRTTTTNTYEQEFKDVMRSLKKKGAKGLVTGDIYEVSGHEKGWLERVCREVGLKPIRPLWQGDTLQIYKDYVAAGFEATVVRTKTALLDEEWLGRKLDAQYLADILKLGNVDPCGENGEYHTFVTDGPNFKNRIELLETQASTQAGFGRLDIAKFRVVPKSWGRSNPWC